MTRIINAKTRFECRAIMVCAAVLLVLNLAALDRAFADTQLRGEWTYGTAGVMQLHEQGDRVRMTLTWTRYSIPGPHYEVVATRSGRNLDGKWRLYPGILPDDKFRGGRFHAEVSDDGNRIVVSRTEEAHNSWNSTVFVRKYPVTGQAEPPARRPGDAWLGRWTANARYSETKQVWPWWFEVSRYCDSFRIQTHTSGPDKVEIIGISDTRLEFHFHDALATHITILREGENRFDGTVSQVNNHALPNGRVDGERIKNGQPLTAELESVQIVTPDTLEAVDTIAMGQSFRIKLDYKTPPCADHTETVNVRTSDGTERRIRLTGKAKRIVSQPILLAPRKKR